MRARWLLAGAAGLALAMVYPVVEFGRGLLEPPSRVEESRLFRVRSGEPFSSVATRLQAEGLVRNARALTWLARLRALDGKLQVGEYEISSRLHAEEVIAILTSGRVKTWPLTVPEGSRASKIARRLAGGEIAEPGAFEAAVENPELAARLNLPADRLEGYLYPDTYEFPRGLKASQVAQVMVRQFDRVWKKEIESAALESALSRHQIVTLASIVEKETAAAEERPLIAAVFLNRLRRGMRLETDPTVIYGIPNFNGNLRRRDLENADNPYNTYRIPGLPPGPIGNPGLAALLSVVEPAETDYLYFVSKNDGTHQFSTTYRQHVDAVNRYQRRRRR